MIGETFGHYRIEAQLGAGGMGVVYRAYDTRLDRTVAVKVLGDSLQADQKARARLLQEARAASALNHPNICTVHDVGEVDGRAFIVMEFVEGKSLRAAIPGGGLPVDAVMRYGAQIADALSHAHERGVIHRDLKSSNIVITGAGVPKVLDFGLAKRLRPTGPEDETRSQDLTEAGTVVGTLAYMPPEALRGEPVDARGDIWAFGVLLYEMACGRQPYAGKSSFDLTAAILRGPAPESLAGDAALLHPIVSRCLTREPGQRYQRAAEVRAALEALESVSVSRTTPVAAVAPVSRRRWVWGIGGAAVAGAAAITGFVQWRRPRTRGPLPSRVPEANEYLKRAEYVLNTQPGELPRMRQLLEKALQLDPQFAYARVLYGFAHLLEIDSGRSNDTIWLYKAEEQLRRALADDPNSARAHAVLGFVYYYQGRKDLIAQEAAKSIALDPNEKDGYMDLAFYHQLNGEYEQSQALFQKLIAADPSFTPARGNFAENLRQMGKPDLAIREHQKNLEQDPKDFTVLASLSVAYLTAGNTASARQALEQARNLQPRNYFLRLLWAVLLAAEGKREEALREMDADLLKCTELITFASYAAEFYAVLGDKAKALDCLDRDVRAGDERAEWFERDPLLKNIRDEPRFRQILESIRSRRQRGTGQR